MDEENLDINEYSVPELMNLIDIDELDATFINASLNSCLDGNARRKVIHIRGKVFFIFVYFSFLNLINY